jgi:hypothetical protein
MFDACRQQIYEFLFTLENKIGFRGVMCSNFVFIYGKKSAKSGFWEESEQ